MDADTFIARIRDEAVVHAIAAAESRSSGEFRVFVSDGKAADPILEAWKTFARLKMNHTRHRNAVLVFVAPITRKFAIVGDEGIHQRCPEGFWDRQAQELGAGFRSGDPTAALVKCIDAIGAEVARHFPPEAGDANELPNRIERDPQ